MSIPLNLRLAVAGRLKLDPAAATYLAAVRTAGGYLIPSIESAVNTLIVTLKAQGLWDKMTAVYPLVGYNSASLAINAKTPGTYNTTFFGTTGPGSVGIVGDGATGRVSTGMSPANSVGSASSMHMAIYVQNRSAGSTGDRTYIGARSAALNDIFQLTRTSALNIDTQINDSAIASYTTPVQSGMFIASRLASNDLKIYRNGTQVASNTTAQVSPLRATDIINILALNTAGAFSQYNAGVYSFASIGSGLSSAEVTNLNSAVETFQISMDRSLYTAGAGPKIAGLLFVDDPGPDAEIIGVTLDNPFTVDGSIDDGAFVVTQTGTTYTADSITQTSATTFDITIASALNPVNPAFLVTLSNTNIYRNGLPLIWPFTLGEIQRP